MIHQALSIARPDLAIDEVMSIAGKTRKNVDVAGSAVPNFPRFFIKISAACAGYVRNIANILKNAHVVTCRASFCITTQRASMTSSKFDKFRQVSGFRDDTKVFLYNHREAHALYSDWNDALLVTADASGDTVNYSYRHFANGALKQFTAVKNVC
jgi:carbamoyltransferase